MRLKTFFFLIFIHSNLICLGESLSDVLSCWAEAPSGIKVIAVVVEVWMKSRETSWEIFFLFSHFKLKNYSCESNYKLWHFAVQLHSAVWMQKYISSSFYVLCRICESSSVCLCAVWLAAENWSMKSPLEKSSYIANCDGRDGEM